MKRQDWFAVGVVILGLAGGLIVQSARAAKSMEVAAAFEGRAELADSLRWISARHVDSMKSHLAVLAEETLAAWEESEKAKTGAEIVVAVAQNQAKTAAAQLRDVLDSLGASTDALDSLEAAHERETTAMRGYIRALEDENDSLWRRIATADSVIFAQDETLQLGLTREAALERANEALRAALRAQARYQWLGGWKDKLVGAAVGYGIAKVGG